MASDTSIADIERTGEDLLERIKELTPADKLADDRAGNGWRSLLVACQNEIVRLRQSAESAARDECKLSYMLRRRVHTASGLLDKLKAVKLKGSDGGSKSKT